MANLSSRLQSIVDALPLEPGMRVLEIGGAPGPAAREIARRIAPGHILVIDRSAKGVAQIERNCQREIAEGVLSVRLASIEAFALEPGEAPFDIVIANRIGVLDGRHPDQEPAALTATRNATTPSAKLFVDGVDQTYRLSSLA